MPWRYKIDPENRTVKQAPKKSLADVYCCARSKLAVLAQDATKAMPIMAPEKACSAQLVA